MTKELSADESASGLHETIEEDVVVIARIDFGVFGHSGDHDRCVVHLNEIKTFTTEKNKNEIFGDFNPLFSFVVFILGLMIDDD